ncbi:MAG: UbiA family prenyltransferase [Verrucomicrobiota bacterium]
MTHWRKKARALLVLGRIANLPTVVSNVAAAWLLAGGSRLSWELLWLMLGGFLFYVGGTTLNDAFDHRFDSEYRKERPIPSGVLSLRFVWTIGVVYMLSGLFLVLLTTGAWWLWVVFLIEAILIYDWLHKRWVGSVFVMGACRVFLVFMAASSVVRSLPPAVLIHAGVLGAYIVGITFTARSESREGPVLRWPLALLLLPAIGVWGANWGHFTSGMFVGTIGYLYWVWWSLNLLKGDSRERIGQCVSALLAGIVLIDVLFVAGLNLEVAVLMLLLFPAALILQRFVPAT